MRKYKAVDVSEKQLEEMVRKGPDLVEEGLRYVEHQKRTQRGPLDVLFADSGNALVVAELKAVEDDGMLAQGIDYYDAVTRSVESFARAYKNKKIDPRQEVRLFLIAPSFSMSLRNRCKWIDIPISLFGFQCIVFEDSPKEIVPVFQEVTVPSMPTRVEVYTVEDKLSYITDGKVRNRVDKLLAEVRGWDKGNIVTDPIKFAISIKVAGTVLAYLRPRRKHFVVSTYGPDDQWKPFAVKSAADLKDVRALLKNNYDAYKSGRW